MTFVVWMVAVLTLLALSVIHYKSQFGSLLIGFLVGVTLWPFVIHSVERHREW